MHRQLLHRSRHGRAQGGELFALAGFGLVLRGQPGLEFALGLPFGQVAQHLGYVRGFRRLAFAQCSLRLDQPRALCREVALEFHALAGLVLRGVARHETLVHQLLEVSLAALRKWNRQLQLAHELARRADLSQTTRDFG